jgi:4-amino-4-deoxy-L-arabinose transferase-like glycosyltransferase
VLLPLLGHRSLAMWDEGIYAEIAREMLHHSALVPAWNYHPWFEKPPLLFWITAGFFRVFGVTEFWARAASALSGIATTAVLHHFLARRFGILTAWMSSIILLSTFGFLHVCRAGEMDALLALSETIAVIGLIHVDEQRDSGWFLFWIGFAAALMTKGAASVVLPITLVCVAVLGRWGRRRFGRKFFGGMAIFLAAVLPWHLAMWHRFGSAFTAQYLGMHVLERASSQMEGHHTHAWFYLLVLLVSAPPWVLVYPLGVAAALRKPELRSLRPLAVFSLVVVLLFTLVKTRLPHYIAPAYPALSALAAVILAHWFRLAASRWRTAVSRGGILVAIACAWALAVIVTTPARKELHSPRMTDGAVTPDTHEPAALLKEAFRSPRPENGPLLLWTEPPIAPITTALFYSRRPVTQVEIPSQSAVLNKVAEYMWNPVPLEQEIGATPRLLLVQRPLLADVPAGLIFTPVASSQHWELGTIVRDNAKP